MKPCSLPPHASPIFLSGLPYLLQGNRGADCRSLV